MVYSFHTHTVTNRTHTYTHHGACNNHNFLGKCFTSVFHELCQGVETDTRCTPTLTPTDTTLDL